MVGRAKEGNKGSKSKRDANSQPIDLAVFKPKSKSGRRTQNPPALAAVEVKLAECLRRAGGKYRIWQEMAS